MLRRLWINPGAAANAVVTTASAATDEAVPAAGNAAAAAGCNTVMAAAAAGCTTVAASESILTVGDLCRPAYHDLHGYDCRHCSDPRCRPGLMGLVLCR